MAIEIWHNPRCSKSRETLQLLADHNPTVRLYLEQNPNTAEICSVLTKLGISARALLRDSEDEYKSLGLDDTSLSETEIIEAMCKAPRLIQRPIVINGNKAAIGRPPESVLEIL